MKKLIAASLCLVASCAISSCIYTTARIHIDPESDLTYVDMPPSIPSQIITYDGFTISFNHEQHIPNWAAWELTADEAKGEEPRSNKFWQDLTVIGCATPDDYKHSGYDRGHMAPAGDMKWNAEAMRQSFSMTNICPQAKQLNTGAWNKLESKCRQRAIADSVVVIICGPVPSPMHMIHIGSTGVTVPESFFKVILSPYTNPPRGIGFIMPNGKVKGGMQACAMSIDEVESATGYDFFSAVPDDIEQMVESTANFHRWSIIP